MSEPLTEKQLARRLHDSAFVHDCTCGINLEDAADRLEALAASLAAAEAERDRWKAGVNLLGYVLNSWHNRPDMMAENAIGALYTAVQRLENGESVILCEPWISDPNGGIEWTPLGALGDENAALRARVAELEDINTEACVHLANVCIERDSLTADIRKLSVQNGKLVDDYNALAEEREAIRATATRCEAYSDGAWRISMETTLARLLAEEDGS